MYLLLLIKIQKCNIRVLIRSLKMSNKFVAYFRGLDQSQKKELATSCKTSVEYLSKQAALMNKDKTTSLFRPATCAAIEIFSNKEITRKDLRPDDWMDIWIELRPNAFA